MRLWRACSSSADGAFAAGSPGEAPRARRRASSCAKKSPASTLGSGAGVARAVSAGGGGTGRGASRCAIAGGGGRRGAGARRAARARAPARSARGWGRGGDARPRGRRRGEPHGDRAAAPAFAHAVGERVQRTLHPPEQQERMEGEREDERELDRRDAQHRELAAPRAERVARRPFAACVVRLRRPAGIQGGEAKTGPIGARGCAPARIYARRSPPASSASRPRRAAAAAAP